MKKNKKIIILLGFSLTMFFIINPKKVEKSEVAKNQKTKDTQKLASKRPGQTPTRAPASVKPVSKIPRAKKYTHPIVDTREYIGKFSDINDLTFVNKVTDDWEEKYKTRFFHNIPDTMKLEDFKIEKKKSIVKVYKNSARNLEHVIVSFKRPDGTPQSFEAMIDSETGTMLQSWNKSHHENVKPATIKATGFAYKRERDF